MVRLPLHPLLLVFFACSDSGGPTEPGERPARTVVSVTISGPEEPLAVGQTAQLEVELRDAAGKPVTGATVEWSSSAPLIVGVSSSGVATALAPGQASIRASSAGRTGSLPLEVLEAEPEVPPPPPPPPAGSRGSIAYVKNGELRLIEPDGTADRRVWALPEGPYAFSGLSWRPDGGEIAFAANHEQAVSLYDYDVYAIRPDGSALRKLTNGPLHSDLIGLPTGTVTVAVQNQTFDSGPYVVYVAGAPEPQSVIVPGGGTVRVTFKGVADLGEGVGQPVVAVKLGNRWWDASVRPDVRGGAGVEAGTLRLTANPVPEYGAHSPFWRGDGSAVGFIQLPTCLLQYVPSEPAPAADGSELVSAEAWDGVCAVDWSPAAGQMDRLLLSDEREYWRNGETRIHLVSEGSSAAGTPVITLGDYSRVVDMRWLPDGSGFIIARDDGLLDVDVNLYEYTLATGAERKITDIKGEYVRFFSVSPDGQSIAFERVTGGERTDLETLPSDLWVVSRDGTGARLLVSGARFPAW